MSSSPKGPAQWVRPEIRALRAYHVPPAEGLIKLDAMENPWPWPGETLGEAWQQVLREAALNRYPDAACRELKAALRTHLCVPDGAELLLGNGSDELIQMIALALAADGRCVMAPEPTFVMYRMIATFTGMAFEGVALNDDFSLNMARTLQAIERTRPAVLFLAWPNNPTGTLFPRAQVAQLIEAAPGLVVVDEAYHAFAEESFLGDVGRWPNLVVMRTLSKTGLAGLRLGMLAGPPAWINEFDKVRLPYNINTLTQLSARFALDHLDVLEAQSAQLRAERDQLAVALTGLPGTTVFPSRANFILIRVPPGRADALHTALREAGILIKNLHGSHPALHDCLRLTIGTPDENSRLLQALSERL